MCHTRETLFTRWSFPSTRCQRYDWTLRFSQAESRSCSGAFTVLQSSLLEEISVDKFTTVFTLHSYYLKKQISFLQSYNQICYLFRIPRVLCAMTCHPVCAMPWIFEANEATYISRNPRSLLSFIWRVPSGGPFPDPSVHSTFSVSLKWHKHHDVFHSVQQIWSN